MTGAELRAWRLGRNLTKPTLAQVLGFASYVTVRQWEDGVNPMPLYAQRMIEVLMLFPEALRMLADRHGISLAPKKRGPRKKNTD